MLFFFFSPHFLSQAPNIHTEPTEVNNQTFAVLTCNLTDANLPIKGSHWVHNGKIIEESKTTDAKSHTSLK